jgi:hypothetical protein
MDTKAKKNYDAACAALPATVKDMTDTEVLAVAGAFDQLVVLEKKVKHGQRRKAARGPQKKNSNSGLIPLLLGQFPDLLTAPVTRERITTYQKWLSTQPGQRRRTPDGLRKAIQRAR